MGSPSRSGRQLPRYPVYIPSKGRSDCCLTARFMVADSVPFYIVVEPQEHDAYAAAFGADRILTLPFSNRGSVIPARNWIMEHAIAAGHARHWQFDDNIYGMMRRFRTRRVHCDSAVALAAMEDFVDRYENIAIAGPNYESFVPETNRVPPFYHNVHVYSASLVLNSLPHRWRGRYNEDTDICLQVLSDGWCTVLFNAFMARKMGTMLMSGGNTTELYGGDGRLKMARSLERMWPGIVETKRRWGRPQHVVKNSWKRFDTPLKLRPGIDLATLPKVDDRGMRLRKKREPRRTGQTFEAVRDVLDE